MWKVRTTIAFWGMGTLMMLPGCATRPQGTTQSIVVENAPRYTPARNGLPTSRIWKSQIAFGDVNADGLPDIAAVSRLADGPWVWVGDGQGNWSEAANGLPREQFCGGGMDFGDFNKDGKMDVLIADHCRGVFAFEGDGTGNWKSASAGLPTIGSEDITAADFDEDGCLDVAIVAASEEGVRAFLGNCKGVWKESSTGLSQTEWGNAIVSRDMNGDGHVDLVAAYSAGPRVWLGNGKGDWSEASEGMPAPEVHGLYWGIAVGDVNGDGRPDVATTDQSRGVEIFLQTETGTWVGTRSRQCAGGTNDGSFCFTDEGCEGGTCATSICKGVCSSGLVGSACLEDKDCSEGSPRPGEKPAAPKCSLNPKVGTACTTETSATCAPGRCSAVSHNHGIPPMNALGIALGDLNNDGRTDLVVAGKTNMDEIGGVYGVYALLGDGKGNFQLLDESYGLPSTGRERTWGVDLADVNGDGVLDIGVAFGDVLPPSWRSGSLSKAEVDKEKPKVPDRGFFGSVQVWSGKLTP